MPPVPESLTRALADRFRVERVLGRGGMATVYIATDLRHHRPVAIKVLAPEIAAEIGQERFLREIEIAARLNHPHILPLHDSGSAGGQLYYVMPYVEEGSLRARLAREPQLPAEDALRIAREIAEALARAHREGLVHRDIKPENILLSSGIALLADFGIARVATGGGAAGATWIGTPTGAIVGTPSYMAPEQAEGRLDVDGRADLYSLACVLYEMLAGRPPFEADTIGLLLHQHQTATPRPLGELRPAVPPGVSTVIARALAKSPAERYATAAAFAEALAMAAAASPTPAAGAAAGAGAPGNLPHPRTHFIGRERELAECARLLAGTRLLTLTGIGGGGKTRLALRLAEDVRDRFADGAWFVDLAPVAIGDGVAPAVAAALGIAEEPGTPVRDVLVRQLRTRRMLLLLDNCEHLVDACAALVDALLPAVGGLQVLATSREGLGVAGEQLVALPPLSLPGTDALALADSDAVRLFLDRAHMVQPSFALDEASGPVVADICRRLDGIPLALELAAARVKVLAPAQILARLDDRFRLLTGGNRALPRHQTLEATIHWNYDQLPAAEQRLLQRLSVFVGGSTLAAAARVAAPGDDEFEVLDRMARLVDKSLVQVQRDATGAQRYGLLDTVREFAARRLADAGKDEARAARQRHLAEFLALADGAYDGRIGDEERWAAAITADQDNLRAALAFARDADAEAYLQLAGALGWYWQTRAHFLEGSEHTAAALAAVSSREPRPALARALWGWATVMAWKGEPAAAIARMEEAVALWRQLGDRQEVAQGLESLGVARWLAGDDAAARGTIEEALRLQLELGDPVRTNRTRTWLAQVLCALADLAATRALSADILAFARARGDRRSEHFGMHFLADCALIEGDCAAALGLYRQSLALALALGDPVETSFEIQGVGMSLAGHGEHTAALRLEGAALAEWERRGADIHVRFWDALRERWFGAARHALGDAAAEAALAEGRMLSLDAAATLAATGPGSRT